MLTGQKPEHITRSQSGPGTNTMIAATNGAICTTIRSTWRAAHVRHVVSCSTHGENRSGETAPVGVPEPPHRIGAPHSVSQQFVHQY